MITSIQENKRKVQQKYQKFKATQLAHSKILGVLDQNKIQRQVGMTQQKKLESQEVPICDKKFQDQYQNILKNMSKDDGIYSFMLTDPKIMEMSQFLKKQAEEKTSMTLMNAFPLRYKSLLQTQANFFQFKKIYKQRFEKLEKQNKTLVQKLLRTENKLKQLNQHSNQETFKCKINTDRKITQYEQLIKKKQLQIYQLKDQYQGIQKKCQKLKNEYKNTNQIIIELRELEENYQKQTQRLVQKLKQTQQKLNRAHKRILQYEKDKNQNFNFYKEQFDQKLREANEENKNLQELLEQANLRVQYKQSLLVMSQQQYQRQLQKQERQLQREHQQMQKLRQDHLEALRTIDQLQERVNRQQQELVRKFHLNDLQKQQIKKQIQKCHKLNGQLKSQLCTKNELIKTLEDSLKSLKQTFSSNAQIKTKQWVQLNKQLISARTQIEIKNNQLKQKQRSQSSLATEIQNLNNKINNLKKTNENYLHKIKQLEKTLKKYLQQILQQQQACLDLKLKVQDWLYQNSRKEQTIQENNSQNNTEIKNNQIKKMRQYEKLIQKLQKQVIILMKNNRQNRNKENKILHDLIQENKQLKSKIDNRYPKKISLFEANR